jgi:hypothetical protein
MVRRAFGAAVGVLAGLAPTSAPAATTSGPATGISLSLDAARGPAVDGTEGGVSVTAT